LSANYIVGGWNVVEVSKQAMMNRHCWTVDERLHGFYAGVGVSWVLVLVFVPWSLVGAVGLTMMVHIDFRRCLTDYACLIFVM
jgi:hypothetical protein